MAGQFKPNVLVTLRTSTHWRRDPRFEDVYGITVPRSERSPVAAVGLESGKDGRQPAHGELLQVFVASEESRQMMDWSQDRIAQALLPEVERICPGASAGCEVMDVARWPSAMAATGVGRAKVMAQYRAAWRGDRRILLAGDWCGFPGTDGAAESGLWCARRILAAEATQRHTTMRATPSPG